MADNNQNKAEQYRQERKARLAKAAKKNAKNIEKKTAVRSATKKIVAIVIAAAIALGCLAGIFNYVGLTQKIIQIGGCGSEKISYQEYLYYYVTAYNNLYNEASKQASQGGSFNGYDPSLSPDKQESKATSKDGSEITWVEYLRENAIDMAHNQLTIYQEAVKAGLELNEAELANIDATIEQLREQADQAGKSSAEDTSKGYSLNAYLRKTYGNGVTESFLKKQLKVEALVSKYYNEKVDEFAKACTAEEVDAVYSQNPDAYQFVDFRFFMINDQTYATAADGEKIDLKAKADAFYNGITDDKSFIALAKENTSTPDFDAEADTLVTGVNKATITQTNEELANWAFDNGTKAGDKKLVESKTADTTTYLIALMVNTKHDVNTVSVRHILFNTLDLQTRQPLSDAEIKAAKANAEKALNDWKAGDKTEDSFAKLATERSADEGTKVNGGLYEARPGESEPAFGKWMFDAKRKPGDCEIVETSYGYHVVYFVKDNGSFKDSTIRKTLGDEKFGKFATELFASEEYTIGFGPRRIEYVEKKALKTISSLVAQQNRNAASQGMMGY